MLTVNVSDYTSFYITLSRHRVFSWYLNTVFSVIFCRWALGCLWRDSEGGGSSRRTKYLLFHLPAFSSLAATLWFLTSPKATLSQLHTSLRSSRWNSYSLPDLFFLIRRSLCPLRRSIWRYRSTTTKCTSVPRTAHVAPGWSGVSWPEQAKRRIITSQEGQWSSLESKKGIKRSPKNSPPRAIVAKDKVTLWTMLTSVCNLAVTNAPCPSLSRLRRHPPRSRPFWNALPAQMLHIKKWGCLSEGSEGGKGRIVLGGFHLCRHPRSQSMRGSWLTNQRQSDNNDKVIPFPVWPWAGEDVDKWLHSWECLVYLYSSFFLACSIFLLPIILLALPLFLESDFFDGLEQDSQLVLVYLKTFLSQ